MDKSYEMAQTSTNDEKENMDNEQSEQIEIEQKHFVPHFGNNCVFIIRNDQPLITVGPHWPLSLCLLAGILFGTYFISQTMAKNKHWFWKYTSFCCGIFLALMFTITSLKNPGIDTAMKPTKYRTGYCKACLTYMQPDTVHCFDCDICVRGHDHHCPWTGKCIGEGNIAYFQMFLCAFLTFFVYNIIVIMA